MNEPTKQRRNMRWFQFSLRTLLVLILVVAAYFAGFSTARKLDEKAMRDAGEKAAAELASAQRAALVAEQQAAAARSVSNKMGLLTGYGGFSSPPSAQMPPLTK